MRRPSRVLGVVTAVTAAGLAGASVAAYWAADAAVPGVAVQSGTLDLTLDGQLLGADGVRTLPELALPDAIPGESVARTVTVGNAGNVALVWRATVGATGGLAPYLTITTALGGTAQNTGTAAQGTRRGNCQGGTPTVPADRTLAAGASEVWCLVVELAADAPSSAQGTTADISIAFQARNVGAPP